MMGKLGGDEPVLLALKTEEHVDDSRDDKVGAPGNDLHEEGDV